MIVEQHLVVAAQLRRLRAAAFAMGAADLEKIGEVVREQNRQPHIDRPIAVIAHAKPLIGGVLPQEDGAQDMHGVLFQDDVLIGNQVGIGQIDGQCGIIVAQVGAEQERRRVVHQELEAREKAGVAVEQPVGRSDAAPMSP